MNKQNNNFKKFFNKKNYIFTLILILLSIGLFTFYWFYTNKKQIKYSQVEQITIFTHGSFGSIIGLMDFFKVVNDNVSGTTYKKTVSKMRKNPRFYKAQPMLQRGLIKIKPSFDLSVTSSKKLAAYPILKAYHKINKQFRKKKISNNFYTFGWSGLLSQERRRKEAIRFYNSLSEELTNYEKIPKIKILTHSHGGNLVLNLAAVHKVINNFNNIENLLNTAINEDEKEALKLMYEQIKNLPLKSENNYTGQKSLDYRPENLDLKVNEFLMFGVPIQQETESFVLSNFFEKIYNIYSDEDIIQDMDIFSTKNQSTQRLKIIKNINYKKNMPQIIQLKIMIDHEMKKITSNDKNKIITLTTSNIQQKIESDNFLKKVFSRNRFSSKKTKDPTHRQLWFVSWDKMKENITSPLEFIPSVIFTPILQKAIEKVSKNINDIDVNIRLTKNNLKFYIFDHNQEEKIIQNKMFIKKDVINSIKSKLLKWIPDDLSVAKEFNIIKQYKEQI